MNPLPIRSILAQSPPPAGLPPFAEYGIAIGICFFLIKEGIAFFKGKDEKESKLTNQLIDDLRNSNARLLCQEQDLLESIRDIQQKCLESQIRMEKQQSEALIRSQSDVQGALKSSALMLTEIREYLLKIAGSSDALHRRLDTEFGGRRDKNSIEN